MDLKTRVYIDRTKATNYLIMGLWSDKMSYKLSDAGIPVVKVPDGTSLGYSVYALNIESSTAGASPAGSGKSQWRLVESAEFVYMQEAYIERLQAALVTAERIESLMIKTKLLEVLEGAKISGFSVGDGVLNSDKKDTGGEPMIVIDGKNGKITVKMADILGKFMSNAKGKRIVIDPPSSFFRIIDEYDRTVMQVRYLGTDGNVNYDTGTTLVLSHFYQNKEVSNIILNSIQAYIEINTFDFNGNLINCGRFSTDGYRKIK